VKTGVQVFTVSCFTVNKRAQKYRRSCFWSSVCGRRDLSGGNTSDFHILPEAISNSGDSGASTRFEMCVCL
jgi:hypothetical protein